MHKNLIIGANSFLSRAISIALLNAGESVEGVIHTNKDKLLEGIKYYSHTQLDQLKEDYKTVYIVSAFIPKKGEEKTQQRLFEVNVQLVEQVVKKFKYAKIIYASSVSVYGDRNEVLTEQSLSACPNTYGLSKWWGEQLVRTANEYAVVRISSMYGKGMHLGTFLPRMIQQALTEKKLSIWGKGIRQQNYIEVGDVAQFLIAAANQNNNDVYLAVDKQSYSNLEIAKMIQAYNGCSINFVGEDNSNSFYYDNQYTLQQLNVSPKFKLEHHIPILIEWIKKMY